MNNEDVKDRKLARCVLSTFKVLGLQVNVVKGDWKYLISDSLEY